jgi:hypothetical protein
LRIFGNSHDRSQAAPPFLYEIRRDFDEPLYAPESLVNSSARPSGERAAFLADACEGDDALLREVQRLLEQPLETAALFVAGAPSVVAHEVRDLTGTRSCKNCVRSTTNLEVYGPTLKIDLEG